MKRALLIMIGLGLVICVAALPLKPAEDKALAEETHLAGSLRLNVSNYGSLDLMSYPAYTGNQLLYIGAPWISAKRQRRNENGDLLYWLAQNPSADSSQVVTGDDPLWQPWLKVVVDTLTSVGFDGDKDLFELLPAHNPLSWQNPYYYEYNSQDLVLKSILGYPSPREFIFPDPEGNYCYSVPQNVVSPFPHFEMLSAYYYDFCPFGTTGDRDLGASRSTSVHYPLGLAVRQHSYAWNLQNFDRFIVIKRIIYNTSDVDTLFDLAVAEYVDCDIKPPSYGQEGASDDVSGYVKGPGYEFAYSRDADGDGGLSPNYLAHKIMRPYFNLNHAAWYWKVGDGPNDYNPRSFYYQPHRTANEKYWLSTGLNADYTKFVLLRPESNDVMQYEQPTPNDTRFLNGVFGAQPTPSDPDPAGRMNLPPGTGYVFYSIYFTGTSIDDLKQRSQSLEDFIMSGLDLGDTQGLACIPYLYPAEYHNDDTLYMHWESYSQPAYYEVKYKVFDAPASSWNVVQVPGDAVQYFLTGLDYDTWYEVKVAAIYDPGPNEVYLESGTQLVCLQNLLGNDAPELVPSVKVKAWPNPFNPETTIEYEVPEAGTATLRVYNTRGQLVRRLAEGYLGAGRYSAGWDGKDDGGRVCASGVYFLRLAQGKNAAGIKLLLMK
jgi:hypothetical protein